MQDQEEKKEEKGAPEEGGRKKLSKKVIIIAAAVLVVVLIVAGVGGFFLMKGSKSKGSGGVQKEHAKAESSKEEKKGEEGPGGTMKQLETFVVNLTDAQGSRYLKVVMQLEMENEGLSSEIDEKTPQIRDEVITVLSSKSFDDLSTIPGKRALKRSIVESVNKYLATGKVVNVYFSEFVVQ